MIRSRRCSSSAFNAYRRRGHIPHSLSCRNRPSSGAARLFETIYIPPVVYDELQRPATPVPVRGQLNPAPEWLKIASPEAADDDYAFRTLDEGEKAALLLGLQLKAELILIDERKGAAVARQKGLRITGTLGILVLATEHDLVSLDIAFARLRETTFRCPDGLMNALIANQKRTSQ